MPVPVYARTRCRHDIGHRNFLVRMHGIDPYVAGEHFSTFPGAFTLGAGVANDRHLCLGGEQVGRLLRLQYLWGFPRLCSLSKFGVQSELKWLNRNKAQHWHYLVVNN
jgi:hypothetical protein